MCFIIPFIWKLSKYKHFSISFRKLCVYFVFIYCLFSSTFTPNLYVYGNEGPGRITNIRFFMLLILMVVSMYLIACFIRDEFSDFKYDIPQIKLLTNIRRIGIVFSISVIFIFGNYTVSNKIDEVAFLSAIKSLHNGEAKEYDRQMDVRTSNYLSDEKRVVVDLITVKPHLLYFGDLSYDSKNWRNRFMAEYFDKEEVVLKKP